MIKHLGNGFLLLVMLCSLGCATTQDEDSYIGWHCSGDKRSDDWTCEQRKVKNGQVVDEPIQDTKTASAVDDNREPEKAELVYAGIPNQSWRKQLPTLTNAKVMTGTPGERRSNLKALPPRQPEPVSSVVAYPLASDSDSITVSEPAPRDTATVVPINEPAIDQGQVAPSSLPGFTLQLGAFKTKEQLQSFIGDNRLENLSVSHVQISSEQDIWHVLTWGEFETPAKALQAWDQQVANYPNVAPWVRPLSTLQTAGSPEEGDAAQES
ncbi:MAG: SPOR domain-containing protein [Porticoccus sp.]|nr:SPOR domain-containing protein [Porticoccus sp.]MBQ0807601.1 SPOR domain-containing protein [Porticoccus sp.]